MIEIDRDRKPTVEPAPMWARVEIPLEYDQRDEATPPRRRRGRFWRRKR